MRCKLNTLSQSKKIINVLDEKKAENILLLDISQVSTFTSYFILCNGSSTRMLDSLASAVNETCQTLAIKPISKDGHAECGWIVFDLGEIIVHIFNSEQREFYDLEELWSNGKTILHLN